MSIFYFPKLSIKADVINVVVMVKSTENKKEMIL